MSLCLDVRQSRPTLELVMLSSLVFMSTYFNEFDA